MDLRDQVRLYDQRHPGALLLIFKPGKGAVIRNRAEQGLGAFATDSQRFALAAIAIAGDMAQLGQHPVLEPTQQRGAFAVGAAIGVDRHDVLHLGPVLHRHPHIGERRFKRLFERPALAGIGAAGLDIDHRFALFAGCIALDHIAQLALGVAPHRQHRMEQPVDRQTVSGNCRRDRIDQKRHVIIDQGQPHEPFAGRASNRFDHDGSGSSGPIVRRRDHEFGGFVQSASAKGRIPRQ